MIITKPQTRRGSLGELATVVAHRMTPDRSTQVSTSVPKVLILSAAEDALIPQTEGEKLKRYVPEAAYQCWEKTGHFVCGQYVEWFSNYWKRYSRKEGKQPESVSTLAGQGSDVKDECANSVLSSWPCSCSNGIDSMTSTT